MKPADNIEQKIKNIKFTTSPDIDKRILSAATDQLDQPTNRQPDANPSSPNIWRTIMKSKLTKLATAAVIFIIVSISIFTFLDKAATPAWAIDQTIEALEDIKSIYIAGTSYDENSIETIFEIWAQPNSDGSASGNFRMETGSGTIAVAIEQENITYQYNPDKKTCRVQDGINASFNPWLGSSLFKILKEVTQNWQVEYGKDQETGWECVFVTCTYIDGPGPRSWWFKFDLETKLPMSFKQWTNINFDGKPQFYAKEIIYNSELPEGIFEFEIPEGVEVIKKQNEFPDLFSDPQYGMAVESLSDEEACVEIVSVWWKSVIDRDWDQVFVLRPYGTPELWQTRYKENPPVRIIELGKPNQQEGCSIGPVIPITVQFADDQIKQLRMIIMFREIDGIKSCIIAGTWGNE